MRGLRANGWRELAWPTVVALVASVVYALLVRDHPAPDIYPDEAHYWLVGRSLADGQGYEWLGVDSALRSIYPLVTALAWWLDSSPEQAYGLVKPLNALLACLTAFPAYALVRRFARPPVAAGLVLLLLAGSWMTMTGRVMTENLSWPIVTAGFAALVHGLADPRRARLIWVAIGLLALAALVRAPLAPLLAVVPAGLVLEWVRRAPDARREWLVAYRAPVIATGGLAVAGLLLLLVDRSVVLGSYADFRPGDQTTPGSVVWWTANNLVESALMTAVIPVVALLSLASSRRAWRDERIAPFLSVAVPAFAVLLLEAGWFEASGTARLIDRYLIALAPLAIAALPAAFGRIRLATALIWTWALAIFAIAIPLGADPVGEADALFGSIVRLFGWPENDPESILVALAAAIVMAGTAGGALLSDWLHERHPQPRSVLAAGAVVAALVVAHTLAVSSWSWQVAELRSQLGRTLLPADKMWVDAQAERRGGGESSILLVAPVSFEVPLASAFFSRTLDSAYRLPGVPPGVLPYDGARATSVGPGGEIFSTKGAPPPARTLLVPGAKTQSTFRDEAIRQWRPELPALLVTLGGRGAPALRTLASAGCRRDRPCADAGLIEVWARQRGSVTLEYDAAAERAVLSAEGARTVLPAGATARLRVPVVPGRNRIQVRVQGRVTQRNTRELVRATLREGRERLTIYTAVPRRGDRDLAARIPR
jgi:hypothetical protein